VASLPAMVIADSLSAQSVPSLRAVAVTEAPVIDGQFGDGPWMSDQLLAGFVQREPIEDTPVSQRTEVRILFDGEALYIGAWLFDEDPSGIVLGQTLRDASLNDADTFSLVLDTYRDRQNGFVFGTTPDGIEYDGQVTNEEQGVYTESPTGSGTILEEASDAVTCGSVFPWDVTAYQFLDGPKELRIAKFHHSTGPPGFARMVRSPSTGAWYA
jgi:hypothetical protein